MADVGASEGWSGEVVNGRLRLVREPYPLEIQRASNRALREAGDYWQALRRFHEQFLGSVNSAWLDASEQRKFLTSEQRDILTDAWLAYCETFEERDTLTTGKRGRPPKVEPFKPRHVDESALRDLRRFYWRARQQDIGWDKDRQRWTYSTWREHLSIDVKTKDGETFGAKIPSREPDPVDRVIIRERLRKAINTNLT